MIKRIIVSLVVLISCHQFAHAQEMSPHDVTQPSEFRESGEVELGICLTEDYLTQNDRSDAVFVAFYWANKKCAAFNLIAQAASRFNFTTFCRNGSFDFRRQHLYIEASAYFRCVTPHPPGKNCSYGTCDPDRGNL